jgi:hypothetical protein
MIEQNATHTEFLAWGKDNGFCPRLAAFLEDKGDFAGATPNQWQELSNIGQTDEFKAKPGDDRRSITISIIGEAA